jgi:hypothetical protein
MKNGSGLIASMAFGVCINAFAASPDLETYTSPDGKFQFAYTALIMCVRHVPNAFNVGYPWEPSDCWDWAEGCGHESSPTKTAVCLAFPATDLKHHQMVTGGTVSIADVTDRANESACLDLSEYLFDGLTTDQVHVGDVTFVHVERGNAGGGHGDSHSIYRSFHNGTCYQIEITVDTLNGDFDMTPDKAMAIFAEDNAMVRNRMKRVVDTFRFLE